MSLIALQNQGTNYRLKCDVYKGGKHGKDGPDRYGKKWDKIKIISENDAVVIVEGPTGDRYAALKDEIEVIS